LAFIYSGYSALGREKVIQFDADAGHDADRIIRDIKESFEIGREDMEEMPNVWFPNGVLPGFKEACLDFYWVSTVPYFLFEVHSHFERTNGFLRRAMKLRRSYLELSL